MTVRVDGLENGLPVVGHCDACEQRWLRPDSDRHVYTSLSMFTIRHKRDDCIRPGRDDCDRVVGSSLAAVPSADEEHPVAIGGAYVTSRRQGVRVTCAKHGPTTVNSGQR